MGMIDASKHDSIEPLQNGTAVMFRTIRADNRERSSEAFQNLESESICRKLFRNKKSYGGRAKGNDRE
jgi:hypothetical protein